MRYTSGNENDQIFTSQQVDRSRYGVGFGQLGMWALGRASLPVAECPTSFFMPGFTSDDFNTKLWEK